MRPPTPEELDEDHKELPAEGMMFVGDKGKILAGFRVENPRLIPERRMSGYAVPPRGGADAARAGTALAGTAPVDGSLQGRRAIARQFPECRPDLRGRQPLRRRPAHAQAPALRRARA